MSSHHELFTINYDSDSSDSVPDPVREQIRVLWDKIDMLNVVIQRKNQRIAALEQYIGQQRNASHAVDQRKTIFSAL